MEGLAVEAVVEVEGVILVADLVVVEAADVGEVVVLEIAVVAEVVGVVDLEMVAEAVDLATIDQAWLLREPVYTSNL